MPTGEGAVRLTQQQRTAITRKQILDAAVSVLFREGYSGATTLRIQQEAGVSRGRLLHQFPSREDLLVAAVQHLAIARIADLGPPADWPDDHAGRIGCAVDLMWSTFQQPYFWASTELWMASRADETLRESLLPHERRLGNLVRETTDALFGADLCSRPHYEVVREQLLTSMRGVALTYAFDPRDPRTDSHLPDWKLLAHTLLAL